MTSVLSIERETVQRYTQRWNMLNFGGFQSRITYFINATKWFWFELIIALLTCVSYSPDPNQRSWCVLLLSAPRGQCAYAHPRVCAALLCAHFRSRARGSKNKGWGVVSQIFPFFIPSVPSFIVTNTVGALLCRPHLISDTRKVSISMIHCSRNWDLFLVT